MVSLFTFALRRCVSRKFLYQSQPIACQMASDDIDGFLARQGRSSTGLPAGARAASVRGSIAMPLTTSATQPDGKRRDVIACHGLGLVLKMVNAVLWRLLQVGQISGGQPTCGAQHYGRNQKRLKQHTDLVQTGAAQLAPVAYFDSNIPSEETSVIPVGMEMGMSVSMLSVCA